MILPVLIYRDSHFTLQKPNKTYNIQMKTKFFVQYKDWTTSFKYLPRNLLLQSFPNHLLCEKCKGIFEYLVWNFYSRQFTICKKSNGKSDNNIKHNFIILAILKAQKTNSFYRELLDSYVSVEIINMEHRFLRFIQVTRQYLYFSSELYLP